MPARPPPGSSVRYGPAEVAIEVVDDGKGLEPPSAATGPFRPADSPVGDRQRRSAGHGIVGMRERAALYGGTLEAGPLPGGGFRVAASLPLEGSG